jgi:DNA repair exonuclease SbcCD ATPase subunit
MIERETERLAFLRTRIWALDSEHNRLRIQLDKLNSQEECLRRQEQRLSDRDRPDLSLSGRNKIWKDLDILNRKQERLRLEQERIKEDQERIREDQDELRRR